MEGKDGESGADRKVDKSSMEGKEGKSSLDRKEGESIAEWINRLIQTYAVVVFSKTYCPHCRRALGTLDKKKTAVAGFDGAVVFELDKMDNGSTIQNELLSLTGQRTVPNIFIGAKQVGGNSEIQALENQGKLNSLITAAVK